MIQSIRFLLKREFFFIPLLGILFTIILTWPLFLNIFSYFPTGGDGVVEAWILWYGQHSLLTGRIFNQTLYFNGPQFYPLPYTIAYSDNLFLLSALFAPLYWVIHNLAFWVNIVTLGTFIFTFCASYFVIKKVTKNNYAGIVGAFIFTYNPITFAHYEPGHINLLSKYFLLLEFYFGYQYITKISLKNTLLFFLFFTFNSLSSLYFEIFTILSLPLFFLPFLIYQLYKKNVFYFKKLVLYSLTFIIFLPVLLYFNLPYLQFSTKEGVVRTIFLSDYYSAKPIDLLASLPNNFIYGPLVRNWDSSNPPKIIGGATFYFGHTLSLDIVPTLLAPLGLFYLLLKKKKVTCNDKNMFIGFSLVFLFSFLMMFGPFFQGKASTIKMPYYYLYYYLPWHLLQGIRAPGRFEFLLYVPFSIVTAYGISYLLSKTKQYFVVTTGILMLLILENSNITNYSVKNPDFVYITAYANNTVMHKLLDNKIILNYPSLDPNYYKEASNYLLWDMFFNTKVVSGNSGNLPNDVFSFLGSLNIANINDLTALKALGVQDVIIHNRLIDAFHLNPFSSENASLILYKDSNITILDISKLKRKITFCVKKQLQYSLVMPKSITQSQPLTYQIIATNNNSCYLISKYQSRYVSSQVAVNGRKFVTYLQFPLIIEPYERVIINETLQNYTNNSNAKVIQGAMVINELGKQFIFSLLNE